MVIIVNDEVLQIRPGQVIESDVALDSPYLRVIPKTKKARVNKENLNKVVKKINSKETKLDG
tara:strand:- start:299 stop:484 length:186 start_codon:yes stop_codon:yes gene_type:complete